MVGCASCKTKNDFPNLSPSHALKVGGGTIPRLGFGQCLADGKTKTVKKEGT